MNFFRRFRFIIIMVILLVAGLVIFSINANRDPRETISGRLVLEITGPVQGVVSSIGDFVSNIWNDYFALIKTAQENDELRKEVQQLRQDLVDSEEIRLENDRLREMLRLIPDDPPRKLVAKVVGWDASSHSRTAIINRGTLQGVQTQMAVVNSQGVVGRIIWASPNYAKVLLLVDPNAGIDVMVQRSRSHGIAEGAGGDGLRLKYIMHNDEVALGDIIVASGIEGVFPRGTLVGKVSSIPHERKDLFIPVEVETSVDFDRLEEVAVILQRRNLDE